jgi:hypothetical protein
MVLPLQTAENKALDIGLQPLTCTLPEVTCTWYREPLQPNRAGGHAGAHMHAG